MASSSASTPAAERLPRRQPCRRVAAFGLSVRGADSVVGCGASAASPQADAPTVSLEVTDAAAIDRLWPAEGGRRISAVGDASAPGSLFIDAHPEAGYLMRGSGYGRALIAASADRVYVAPDGASQIRWQRYVIGQVLPLVAGLNGVEMLHAGAVRVGDVAIALLGPSGTGKSSLVTALVNRGARLLTDDVLALDGRSRRVVVQPGPGAVILSDAALGLQTRSPGDVLARGDGEVALAVTAAPPAPLEFVCFLGHGASGVNIGPAEDAPRRLIGGAYEVVRRDPQRRLEQLELMSALAAGARLVSVTRDADASPDVVARALLSELGLRP